VNQEDLICGSILCRPKTEPCAEQHTSAATSSAVSDSSDCDRPLTCPSYYSKGRFVIVYIAILHRAGLFWPKHV
jgi:hypothetical protein